MLIRYPTLRIQNPQVDMSSYLAKQLCYENPLSKHVSQDPQWNQSLLLLIKLERKLNEFGISKRIFHVGQN
jgi:hypothetical protein